MLEATVLEAAVFQCIADNPDQQTAILDAPKSASIMKRENIAGGFFAALKPDPGSLVFFDLPSPIGDAWVAIEGLQYGAGCMIFLKEGSPTKVFSRRRRNYKGGLLLSAICGARKRMGRATRAG
jgi:hypothetical protein